MRKLRISSIYDLPEGRASDSPSNRLANLSDLKPDEPMDIACPDADSPGVLLKPGRPMGAPIPA